MADTHNLNIQNTNLTLSFKKKDEEHGDKNTETSWIDIERQKFLKSHFLFMFDTTPDNTSKHTHSIDIEINNTLLAVIIDTINANLHERKKSILFELKNLLK